jgi:sRNA-binding regulator protein Hfq
VNQRFTEDAWLDAHIDTAIDLYLCSGIKLMGLLQSHDIDVIVIGNGSDDPGQDTQMIYKSAISTIQPIRLRQAIRGDQAPVALHGRPRPVRKEL